MSAATTCIYQRIWTAAVGEVLHCERELTNSRDQGRTQEFEKGVSRVGMVVRAWIIETRTHKILNY